MKNYRIVNYLRKNGSTILTSISVVGLWTTAIFSATGTIKAYKKQVETKKSGIDLAKSSIIYYIPAIISGSGSAFCIIMSHKIDQRSIAALSALCLSTNAAFLEYQKKTKEIIGSDNELKIRSSIAEDHKPEEFRLSEGKELFYDELSKRWFESTTMDVFKAEYELNRRLANDYRVPINCFYDNLKLKHIKDGYLIGYSISEMEDWYGSSWIEFVHEKLITQNGEKYTMISFPIGPSYCLGNEYRDPNDFPSE